MVRSGLRAVLKPVDLVLTRLAHTVALKDRIAGIDVLYLVDDHKEEVLPKIREALNRLESTAPWRLAHLRRNASCIFITGRTSRTSGRTILLPFKMLEENEPDWIALQLVYYGALLRVRRRRGRGTQMRRLRLAFEEQLAFARRLPDYGFYVGHLTKAWDAAWWMDAKRRHQRVIEESDFPRWFQRLAVWLNQ